MQIITDRHRKEIKKHGDDSFPLLVSEERISRYEAGAFLWHWHPEMEFTLINSGEMLYQINDRSYILRRGEALLGNANVLHAGSMYRDQDCAYTAITFDPKILCGQKESRIYRRYVEPVVQNYSIPAVHLDLSEAWHTEAIGLFRDICTDCREAAEGYEIDVAGRLLRFWKLLYGHCGSGETETAHDRRDYERIRSILGYIEAHYMEKLSLGQIAEQVHLCKSECCRLFKRYMKMSLFEFILEYRIEKSMVYLGDSNYSIAETAYQAGFSDPNYYSKVFGRCKGMPPARYRRKIRQQQETAENSGK